MSVAAAIIVGLLWYGIWAAVAFGALLFLATATPAAVGPVSGALLIMTLYWQLIPMMMASAGMSLDLNKLKCYPIPTRDLFTIEVLLRVTASGEMLLVLLGAAIGVLFNPNLRAWGAIAVIPFAAMQMLLSLGIRDIVSRLLSRRRLRELSMLIFILIFMLPRILVRDSAVGKWFLSQVRATGFSGDVPLWPFTAAGHFLLNQDVGIATIALSGWTAIAFLFARWQFNRTLVFDVDAARSAGESRAKSARISFMERLYRLPSTILRDPLGALIEKEMRYLARAPQFRMMILMGCVFGLVISRGPFRETPALWAPNYLVIATAYSLLLIGTVCIWNAFGFDRSAVQIYFLAPIPFSKVLIAKNIAAAAWIGFQLLMLTTLSAILRFPLSVGRVAEAAGAVTVIVLLLFAVGNYVAVSNPRPMDPEIAMRTRSAGGMQLLILLVYPLTFVPIAMAYFARWAFSSNAAFFGTLTVLAAIAFVVYRVALDSAARQAEEQKEQFVAALSAGSTPIAGS
jgi:ABC-2 type transport system permease protein